MYRFTTSICLWWRKFFTLFCYKTLFKKEILKNTNVCFCVCIWHMCVHGSQKRTSHLLEVELQRVVGTRGRHCRKISHLPSPRGLNTHNHREISPDFYILFSKKIVSSFLEFRRKNISTKFHFLPEDLQSSEHVCVCVSKHQSELCLHSMNFFNLIDINNIL